MTWDVVPFSEAVRDVSSGNVKIPKSEYQESGSLAVIDQGQRLVAGFVDDAGAAHKADLPVIVFGDHTRAFKFADFPFAVGADGVKVLAAKSGFDPKFLYWYLSSLDIPSAGYARHYKFLKEREILKPSLTEQKRIAAILDQVDALRAKRREVVGLLEDLTQAIYLDMFGDPFRNPRGFPVCDLESLVVSGDRINYGVVQPGSHVDGGVPLIRSGDLRPGGVGRESLMRISPDIEAGYSRSRIRGNEILVGCVGAIGAVAVVDVQDIGSNVARAVARVPIASDVDRQYLAAYLRMEFVQRYFERELRTVAQPTLNIKQLKEAPVVLPPSDLRAKFVERTGAVVRQGGTYLTHLAALDELFASLQQRAFSGRLWECEAA
ncbi:restriction endonuclease subunit S [Streptomyces sp. NRRL F-5193]|uniref:restriction endonuclease subunit S n=1 Tax=Streptomyces sp. NRRL F-5193 TaxID=1463860 RepID=UPI000A5E14AA|nr:restriction endonuclease subunit S [Streptomyces sp. NRRL F-5193]